MFIYHKSRINVKGEGELRMEQYQKNWIITIIMLILVYLVTLYDKYIAIFFIIGFLISSGINVWKKE